MKQRTLSGEFHFEGKGLHTGKMIHMTVGPAPAGSGVRLLRTDLGGDAYVDAGLRFEYLQHPLPGYEKDIKGMGFPHLYIKGHYKNLEITAGDYYEQFGSGFVLRTYEERSLGIDNALVRLDGPEAPILDGSAAPYVAAFAADGGVEQEAERKWLELREEVRVEDRRSGAYLKITPAEEPSYDVTIDFNSKVLGVQRVHWDSSVDYATQIAPCRTFCFFHEIRRLALLGMIKGGDLENAIVVLEKAVPGTAGG